MISSCAAAPSGREKSPWQHASIRHAITGRDVGSREGSPAPPAVPAFLPSPGASPELSTPEHPAAACFPGPSTARWSSSRSHPLSNPAVGAAGPPSSQAKPPLPQDTRRGLRRGGAGEPRPVSRGITRGCRGHLCGPGWAGPDRGRAGSTGSLLCLRLRVGQGESACSAQLPRFPYQGGFPRARSGVLAGRQRGRAVPCPFPSRQKEPAAPAGAEWRCQGRLSRGSRRVVAQRGAWRS